MICRDSENPPKFFCSCNLFCGTYFGASFAQPPFLQNVVHVVPELCLCFLYSKVVQGCTVLFQEDLGPSWQYKARAQPKTMVHD